jgi:ubiquinone/menaquinone biosynthesis C-methylase UbiE
MSGNTERFTGRVSEYEKFRKRYPVDKVLGMLREWCGLTSEWLVADVGAGTGMLAEVFLENGNRVMAIEPNAEMRAACELLVERWPKLRVKDATAEETTLEEASLDIVAAGRAFHWFDTEKALAEFRRILRPGGWVVLVSVGRSKAESKQSEEYETLLAEHGTNYFEYVRSGYRVHERLEDLFAGGVVMQHTWQIEDGMTLEEFIGQAMSTSVAPLPGHEKYEGMQQALREFFARYAVDGTLTMGLTGWLMCAQFAQTA